MDFGFPWNLTAVALLLPIILLFLINRKNPKPVSVKWPPGPKTLPIIGSMHLLSSLAFRSFNDLAKQYGPLMRVKLGEVDAIVVSSPEIAREILKQHDPCYADRPGTIGTEVLWYGYLDIAFSPYGEYWRQMRKICIMELLSPSCVRSFASIRKDEISNLIQSIRLHAAAHHPVNISERIFSMMSSVTCRAAFGKVSKDNDALIKILKDGIAMASGYQITDFFPSSLVISSLSWTKLSLLMMRRRLDSILDGLIDQHRVNLGRKGDGEFGNEDLVDVLLRLQETGELQFPIRNENIKAVIYDMFSGGTETSSTLMDWVMVELMRNPQVMAKVIREALRMHPPVPLVGRVSREEREINGYKIPVKVKVLVNSWGMQRDPKYWKDPEKFEPERFERSPKEFLGGDFDYLPFGAGKRMCPGITFSMASVELVLAQLLYHFDWKLPAGVEPESMDMIENPGLTVSRRDSLYAVATPCNNSP